MHSGPNTPTVETNDEREIRIKAVIAALNFDRGTVRLFDDELVIALENAEKTLTEILAIPALAGYAIVLAEQLGVYYGYHPRNQKKATEKFIIFKEAATRKLNIDPKALEYARACMYLEHAKTNVQDKDYYEQALKTAQDFEVSEEKPLNDAQITKNRTAAINNFPGLPEYAHACMYSGYVGTIQGSYHDERLFVEALAVFNNYEKKLAAENALTPEKIAELKIEKGYIACFLGLQIHRKSYLVGKTEAQRIKFLENAIQHLVAAQELQRAALDFIGPITPANSDLYLQVTIELANTYHIQGVVSGKMYKPLAEKAAYEEAMKLEAAYEYATGLKHFLTFVTLQNYSLTLANNFNLNQAENALTILTKALADQLEHYRDKKTWKYVENFDIAKTHHYTGMVLVTLGRNAEAAACFQQSYDMKIRLGSSRFANEVLDSLTCLFKATRIAINGADISIQTVLHTVKSVDMFNWTDYKTIKPFEKYVEALAEMTDLILRTMSTVTDPDSMLELLPTLYQLGAFYVHVPRNPARAHQYLEVALGFAPLLGNVIDNNYAWILNHSAFANQQRLAQSFGKPLHQLREDYNQYNPLNSNLEITEQEIRDIYYGSANEQATGVLLYQAADLLTKNRLHGFANLIIAYANYERQRVMTDRNEKRQIMAGVVQQVGFALGLYEAVNDLGEQYLRAKNRQADLISEYVLLLDDDLEKAALPSPLKIYEEIEVERKRQKTDKGNIWAGRFYYSFGKYLDNKLFKKTDVNYLSDVNISYLQMTIEKYSEAHSILAEYEGAKDPFTLDVLKRKLTLQIEFAELLAALDPIEDKAKIAQLPDPLAIYESIEKELKKHELDKGQLAEKFYASFHAYLKKSFISNRNDVNYLSAENEASIGRVLKKYTEIYDALCATHPDGWKDPSALAVLDIKKDLELRLDELRELRITGSLPLTSTTSSLADSTVGSLRSDEDDVKLTAAQQSQALNTGSTTTTTGLFANSAQAAAVRQAAHAALATQLSQTRQTGPMGGPGQQ